MRTPAQVQYLWDTEFKAVAEKTIIAMEKRSPEERKQIFTDCVASYEKNRMSLEDLMFISLLYGLTEGGTWFREAVSLEDRLKESEAVMIMDLPKDTKERHIFFILGQSGGAA